MACICLIEFLIPLEQFSNLFKTENHSTTVCKGSCIKTDSELQIFYCKLLLLITKLRQKNQVSRQVLALKGWKFVAVTLPSVLSRENRVCTPRVGADEHQVLVLKGWKFVLQLCPLFYLEKMVLKHQKLVLINKYAHISF